MRLSLFPPHTQHSHYYRYHHPIKFHHSSSTRMDGLKDKVIVIMGATGSGKSRLSIDLATLFPSSEIINSDKMQVYSGLDITTNKIPLHHRRGVPHHLLGEVQPSFHDFSPSDFRRRAGYIISDITSRRKRPILVGGSNSFVHALLVQHFTPESNVFDDTSSSSSISSELRYECCFLWMDISFPVLYEYLLKRVDDMLDSGMLDELAQFFNSEKDKCRTGFGLRKAIGVPEFDRFFKEYPNGLTKEGQDPLRERAYQEAVRAIKENTCKLAEKTDREDPAVTTRRVGPTEDRRHGSISGGADVRFTRRLRYLGETGVGTKREDCEAVLDGVGLPANSSYSSHSNFYFYFLI